MYKHIILAYDGSASGQKALLEIKELAHWGQPHLTLVAVVPTPMDVGSMEMGYYASTNTAAVEEQLNRQLSEGVAALKTMGFTAHGELIKGEVIRALSDYAEHKSADLLVVGHQHEKNLLRRWWSGSTAKALVDESPCNVLIVVDRGT